MAGVWLAGALLFCTGGAWREMEVSPKKRRPRHLAPSPHPGPNRPSPKRPGGHWQWNMPAPRAWHGAPPRQGLGWQGCSPHSPTPELRDTPPCQRPSSRRWLLTSSRRMQPFRPMPTEVRSRALPRGRVRVSSGRGSRLAARATGAQSGSGDRAAPSHRPCGADRAASPQRGQTGGWG